MELLELKKRLFSQFGGFADGRIKDLSKSDRFICDDREHADNDAKGKLFYWYVTVYMRAISGDVVHIDIGDAMPQSKAVKEWMSNNTIEGEWGRSVIEIKKGEQGKLKELAALISSITDKPYDVRHYKYTCPEVASVLRRTADVLATVWSD
ncbi:hypothetical protein [Hansschlegelia plantiphila]|uniref:Uncharacterized protein n=1 Tax=Hansschlegelia plantiphila TaxID=374655 RepID=A0A9W6MVZ2_9HYPH|nr:hypothetical protein [Hansschlegelia plantiphila]GLK68964.1 hypothetical protein GCM10008179_26020 [Hansschlegelia plantiphila]